MVASARLFFLCTDTVFKLSSSNSGGQIFFFYWFDNRLVAACTHTHTLFISLWQHSYLSCLLLQMCSQWASEKRASQWKQKLSDVLCWGDLLDKCLIIQTEWASRVLQREGERVGPIWGSFCRSSVQKWPSKTAFKIFFPRETAIQPLPSLSPPLLLQYFSCLAVD